MAELGVDYSWARPSPAALKKAGYSFVIRYLSPDPSKNLTPTERDALHKAGLKINLVWEGTADAALQGRARATADRKAAVAQAKALQYPKGCTLFMAVDFAATAAQVADYVAAAVAFEDDYKVGLYGDGAVLAAHPKLVRWQAGGATSWPGNAKVLSEVNLYQRRKPTLAGAPSGVDENILLHDFQMWEPVTVEPGQNPSKLGLTAKQAAADLKQVAGVRNRMVRFRKAHPVWAKTARFGPAIRHLRKLAGFLRKRS